MRILAGVRAEFMVKASARSPFHRVFLFLDFEEDQGLPQGRALALLSSSLWECRRMKSNEEHRLQHGHSWDDKKRTSQVRSCYQTLVTVLRAITACDKKQEMVIRAVFLMPLHSRHVPQSALLKHGTHTLARYATHPRDRARAQPTLSTQRMPSNTAASTISAAASTIA